MGLDAVGLGGLHVAAACLALAVGLAVLVRRKGGAWHVAAGRVYLGAMLAVNLPVLLVYEQTGGPGAFHLLAVVSLVTTALGWAGLRGWGPPSVGRHAAFMTWSFIGVATAGLAQLANQQLPARSPWPVLAVVAVTTALGLLVVPRYVARQLRRRARAAR
jgi:uncharacterized membrane protein